MRFSTFILQNLDQIVKEWVVFARQVSPSTSAMSTLALADHSRAILVAIAKDMETGQDEQTRRTKAEGHAPEAPASEEQTAATAHGAVRHNDGFDLDQMVSEYRALRACVLKRWREVPETVEDRARLVEEIARFNEGIDQALAESMKQYSSDVAKSRDLFLGVLSHDLRGPLSTIVGSTAILAMPNASPEIRQRVLERIERSSRRMGSLMDDLLDYTQTRSGHGLRVNRSSCDLRKICEEAIDAVTAANPEQQFDVNLVGDLVLQADEKRLEQLLSNLLNNAVQHGLKGAAVSLAAHGDAGMILLSVKNLGRPIRPAALPCIFDPLVQGFGTEGDAEYARGNIGLGLFIVREIVRGHHGAIDVASSEASGTVFTVRLPRAVG